MVLHLQSIIKLQMLVIPLIEETQSRLSLEDNPLSLAPWSLLGI